MPESTEPACLFLRTISFFTGALRHCRAFIRCLPPPAVDSAIPGLRRLETVGTSQQRAGLIVWVLDTVR